MPQLKMMRLQLKDQKVKNKSNNLPNKRRKKRLLLKYKNNNKKIVMMDQVKLIRMPMFKLNQTNRIQMSMKKSLLLKVSHQSYLQLKSLLLKNHNKTPQKNQKNKINLHPLTQMCNKKMKTSMNKNYHQSSLLQDRNHNRIELPHKTKMTMKNPNQNLETFSRQRKDTRKQ